METWKKVKGYEGLYEVSNTGNVKSLPRNTTQGGILKTSITSGYICCGLWKDGKGKMVKVHRLIADAFIENKKNLPQVNHIDGSKINNVVGNLEWVTSRENATHREIKNSKKKSKCAGVSYSEYKGKKYWKSFSYYKGKVIHIGSFNNEEDASKAYLNFIKENNIQNRYAVKLN